VKNRNINHLWGDGDVMSNGATSEMNKDFTDIFDVMTPYGRYQLVPAELLLAGHNVILRAPTGSGKTNAALFPFLLSRKRRLDFPNKMIYCVPMRVLARSFYENCRISPGCSVLDVRQQTGEQQDDPKLEGDITFATIDQVLSSFLNIPYSLSLRQGNINAGAVISSYLVFDEFHLFAPDSTLPTTLEMLRMVKGVAPFLLMTATFSEALLERLAALLSAKIVTVTNEDLKSIPTQRGKERKIHCIDAPLTAEKIVRRHQKRTIVICNTIERAQVIYRELTRKIGGSGTEILLLHSRFLKEHRRVKEDRVRVLFGKEGDNKNAILVATQVIEVGLDITCDVMFTEAAPASSVLQRIGRCARFEQEKGDIYVCQIPFDDRGKPNYAPYLGEKQTVLCDRTWKALMTRDGQNVDFSAEMLLINEVHNETDAQMLDALQSSSFYRRKEMINAINQQELGLARGLIRKNDSSTVLAHDEPDEIRDPYVLEGFSLFTGSLCGLFQQWHDRTLPNSSTAWIFKYPVIEGNSEGEDREARYIWKAVNSIKDLKKSNIYAINPVLVSYSPEVGLSFTGGGGFSSPLLKTRTANVRRYRHTKENYQQHIEKMLQIAHIMLKELDYTTPRLEERLGLMKGQLEKAVCLIIALHDVGKMDKHWQCWAHEWQQQIGVPVEKDCILAHTDYDRDNLAHIIAEAKMTCSRPNHAGEGALAVGKIIFDLLGNETLTRVGLTAIARHHTPSLRESGSFFIPQSVQEVVSQMLASVGLGAGKGSKLKFESKRPEPLDRILIDFNSPVQLIAYFFLVRLLRLVDQEATGRE
jgi:CRISPR-associated endonuclease/helicase Cas3